MGGMDGWMDVIGSRGERERRERDGYIAVVWLSTFPRERRLARESERGVRESEGGGKRRDV